MREILFRGKSVEQRNNGRWIEGSLITLDDTHVFIVPRFEGASTLSNDFIVSSTMEAVDPSTVGQYTGLNDKKNNKIFEGDILQFDDCGGEPEVVVVVWDIYAFAFEYHIHGTTFLEYDICPEQFEIIGNIHDNADLLK